MMNRARRATLGALAVGSCLVGACKDSATAPEPFVPVATGLTISADEREVYAESEIQFGAAVNDQRGSPMTTQPILWVSRDPTTATVDVDGTVRGVAAGEVWIVATSGALADSVSVDVRFHVLADEVRVRVRGAMEFTEGWDGGGIKFDLLGTEEGDVAILTAFSADFGTYFIATVPGDFVTGVTPLFEFDLNLLNDQSVVDLAQGLGYLVIEESRDRMQLYRSTGASRIQVDSITATLQGGPMVWGRLVLETDGFLVERDDDWELHITPTEDEIRLDADFAARLEAWPVGLASFEMTDGGQTVTGEKREAWWHFESSGSARGRIDIEDGPPYMNIFTDLVAGTVPIDPIGTVGWTWDPSVEPGTFFLPIWRPHM